MTPLTLAIAPLEVPGLIVKAFAILSGALVGGLFIGFVARFLTRVLANRALPFWGVQSIRLAGGVASGWLVSLFMTGGGFGFGFGGGEGPGPGQGGGANRSENRTERAADEQPAPKEEEDRGKGTQEIIRVGVLGYEPLKSILGPDPDIDYCYRIEGESRTQVYDLEGIKSAIQQRQEKEPNLKVLLVIYRDSPDENNEFVVDLRRWLQDENLYKDWDRALSDAPR